MRLRRTNGAIQKIYNVGDTPQNILFDGTSIWGANFYDDTVNKISLAAAQ
jgi:hypothetical protein